MVVLALLAGLLLGVVLGAALAGLAAVRRRSAMTAELAVADARAKDAEARLVEERAALSATIEQVSAKMVLTGTARLAELAGERFDQAAQALRSDLDVRDARL